MRLVIILIMILAAIAGINLLPASNAHNMLAAKASIQQKSVMQNSMNTTQEEGYKAIQIYQQPRKIFLFKKAYRWALRHRGIPYVWGATGPNGYDCSGFVYADWHLRWHKLRSWTRTVAGMVHSRYLIPIRKRYAKRGDLVVFNYTQHIELYAGSPAMNHKYHHFYTLGAAHSGTVTAIHNQDYKWWYHIRFYKVRGSREKVRM